MMNKKDTTQELANREWQSLHRDIERYEAPALAIKAISLAIVLFYVLMPLGTLWCLCLLLLLWLQEGIWRTSQARLVQRVENLESLIHDENSTEKPFYLYTSFLQTRGTASDLFGEYIANAFRPTVAFPHVVFFGLVVLARIF